MLESTEYSAEMAQWQAQRLESLRNPEGYLSLVGLCWLKEGINHIGADEGNDCVFPSGSPPSIGTVTVNDGAFHLSVSDTVHVEIDGETVSETTLLADRDVGGPTIVQLGSMSWFIIRRGDALLIRIRDAKSNALQTFKAVERFPLNEAWRISAEFLPHDSPQTVMIPNMIGIPDKWISPGTMRLTVNGNHQTITALKSGNTKRLFLVVADQTSGKETYGGGRFVTTEAVDDSNHVIVDFNKATNPPCAFSPYATCPLPLPENRLQFPILAGEKTYHY